MSDAQLNGGTTLELTTTAASANMCERPAGARQELVLLLVRRCSPLLSLITDTTRPFGLVIISRA